MIRRMERKDREEYLKMTGEFYASDAVLHEIPLKYRSDAFEELMRSEDYVTAYLLEQDGKAAGYALLSRQFSQEAGGMALWIDEIYIRPPFRGRGLGSEFFRFLDENIHGRIKRLRLETEPENKGAQALYRRLGFRPLGYLQMIKED
ncbi:N-acetyltransferase [Ruminococcaceae bacterium BL-6]|nr:N-acetyltransferase [Ruminococcaceae bacterium BL-6]